jgi:hypothetical protein
MNSEALNQEHIKLATEMFAFANLEGYELEMKDSEGRIIFISKEGIRLYELWEVSEIWNASLMDGTLVKKHEEFYFVVKAMIVRIFEEKMDNHF